MNILLINHYAGSPEMGMEYRPYYLAREWTRLGHKVTIVAASYAHLRSKNPQVNEPLCEKITEKLRYVFIKTPHYTENDHKRYKNIYRFLKGLNHNVTELAEHYKPDIVIASSTYPLDIYPAKKIAAAAGARLVYEVHDIHPDSCIELYDYSPYHPIMLALGRAAKYAYKNADIVISVLPRVDLHMKKLGFSDEKFVFIPNGIEPAEKPQKQPQRHIDLIERYREKGNFIVMYLGGFAPANALDELIESAKKAPKDVLYLLVGNGVHKTPLKRYARQNGLNNILYLDTVEKTQVSSILALADCLYIGALPLKVYKYGVGMNKMYDYMYSARPVICAMDVPENPIEKAKCGIIVQENTGEEIAEAIEKLREMTPKERSEMGARGRKYVEEHNMYSVLAQKFLNAVVKDNTPKNM